MTNTVFNAQILIEAQNKASQEIEKISDQLKGLEKNAVIGANGINGAYNNLKSDLASLGLADKFRGATKSVLDLGGSLEQAHIAFGTMLGSEEKATGLLEDLSDFAKKTPFELVGIRDSAKQLLAMGVKSDDLIGTLKSLGDVSSGLSVPLDRIALNYGQIIAQGKLTGREVRDFAIAGVPIVDELAKMLGKSTSEIQDMVSAGDITAEHVTQAFQTMSGEGGKFENLMSKQSGTFKGQMSNLTDSFNSLKESLGQAIIPILTTVLKSLIPIVDRISKWVENNPILATTIFSVVGALVAFMGSAVVLGPIISAVMNAVSLLGGAIALLGGPITIAIAALGLLVLAYNTNFLGLKDFVQGIVNDMTAFWETHKDTIISIATIMFETLATVFTLGLYPIVQTVITNRDSIVLAFNNAYDLISGVMSNIMTTIEGAWDYVTGITGEVLNYIQNTVGGIIGSINDAINGLRNLVGMSNEAAVEASPTASAVRLAGARAKGGPVYSGQAYLVGEKGPEVFVPGASGNIIPNGASQSVTINLGGVTIANAQDEKAFIALLEKSIVKASRNLSMGVT